METAGLLLFGAAVGVLSGVLGIGGGVVLVPGLVILFGFSQPAAQGTSLAVLAVPVVVFAALVLLYAIAMQGTSIYELVSSAYQVTLVGAFVPLVLGLYWKRSTTQGAITSIAAGVMTWLVFFPQISSLGEAFPGQLAGLIAAFVGHVLGSLAPQVLRDRQERVHHAPVGTV